MPPGALQPPLLAAFRRDGRFLAAGANLRVLDLRYHPRLGGRWFEPGSDHLFLAEALQKSSRVDVSALVAVTLTEGELEAFLAPSDGGREPLSVVPNPEAEISQALILTARPRQFPVQAPFRIKMSVRSVRALPRSPTKGAQFVVALRSTSNEPLSSLSHEQWERLPASAPYGVLLPGDTPSIHGFYPCAREGQEIPGASFWLCWLVERDTENAAVGYIGRAYLIIGREAPRFPARFTVDGPFPDLRSARAIAWLQQLASGCPFTMWTTVSASGRGYGRWQRLEEEGKTSPRSG